MNSSDSKMHWKVLPQHKVVFVINQTNQQWPAILVLLYLWLLKNHVYLLLIFVFLLSLFSLSSRFLLQYFLIISIESYILSWKLKYQFGLLYSFRYIEIFKSSKADIKYVSKPKLKPLMSTRPGPYDRSPGGFGGGRGRFGGVVAGDGRRYLLLILIA